MRRGCGCCGCDIINVNSTLFQVRPLLVQWFCKEQIATESGIEHRHSSGEGEARYWYHLRRDESGNSLETECLGMIVFEIKSEASSAIEWDLPFTTGHIAFDVSSNKLADEPRYLFDGDVEEDHEDDFEKGMSLAGFGVSVCGVHPTDSIPESFDECKALADTLSAKDTELWSQDPVPRQSVSFIAELDAIDSENKYLVFIARAHPYLRERWSSDWMMPYWLDRGGALTSPVLTTGHTLDASQTPPVWVEGDPESSSTASKVQPIPSDFFTSAGQKESFSLTPMFPGQKVVMNRRLGIDWEGAIYVGNGFLTSKAGNKLVIEFFDPDDEITESSTPLDKVEIYAKRYDYTYNSYTDFNTGEVIEEVIDAMVASVRGKEYILSYATRVRPNTPDDPEDGVPLVNGDGLNVVMRDTLFEIQGYGTDISNPFGSHSLFEAETEYPTYQLRRPFKKDWQSCLMALSIESPWGEEARNVTVDIQKVIAKWEERNLSCPYTPTCEWISSYAALPWSVNSMDGPITVNLNKINSQTHVGCGVSASYGEQPYPSGYDGPGTGAGIEYKRLTGSAQYKSPVLYESNPAIALDEDDLQLASFDSYEEGGGVWVIGSQDVPQSIECPDSWTSETVSYWSFTRYQPSAGFGDCGNLSLQEVNGGAGRFDEQGEWVPHVKEKQLTSLYLGSKQETNISSGTYNYSGETEATFTVSVVNGDGANLEDYPSSSGSLNQQMVNAGRTWKRGNFNGLVWDYDRDTDKWTFKHQVEIPELEEEISNSESAKILETADEFWFKLDGEFYRLTAEDGVKRIEQEDVTWVKPPREVGVQASITFWYLSYSEGSLGNPNLETPESFEYEFGLMSQYGNFRLTRSFYSLMDEWSWNSQTGGPVPGGGLTRDLFPEEIDRSFDGWLSQIPSIQERESYAYVVDPHLWESSAILSGVFPGQAYYVIQEPFGSCFYESNPETMVWYCEDNANHSLSYGEVISSGVTPAGTLAKVQFSDQYVGRMLLEGDSIAYQELYKLYSIDPWGLGDSWSMTYGPKYVTAWKDDDLPSISYSKSDAKSIEDDPFSGSEKWVLTSETFSPGDPDWWDQYIKDGEAYGQSVYCRVTQEKRDFSTISFEIGKQQ